MKERRKEIGKKTAIISYILTYGFLWFVYEKIESPHHLFYWHKLVAALWLSPALMLADYAIRFHRASMQKFIPWLKEKL